MADSKYAETLSASGLLSESDPAPVEVFNAGGSAPYVLTCEHASNTVPESLGDMGLDARHLERHIAWDIGVDGLSRMLATMLDAPLVLQRYSRLVIDCNRPFQANDFIPEVSDGTEVPANRGLSAADREARISTIHAPYHQAISDILDDRLARQVPTALVAVHSFTPCLEAKPAPRPWDIGLLFNRHETLSRHVLDELETEASHLHSTFNEPYRVCDHEDYTIPVHGEKRGIPNMLLEIRNDNIEHEAGQLAWAELLGGILKRVAPRLQDNGSE